jgi:hypothetical protein
MFSSIIRKIYHTKTLTDEIKHKKNSIPAISSAPVRRNNKKYGVSQRYWTLEGSSVVNPSASSKLEVHAVTKTESTVEISRSVGSISIPSSVSSKSNGGRSYGISKKYWPTDSNKASMASTKTAAVTGATSADDGIVLSPYGEFLKPVAEASSVPVNPISVVPPSLPLAEYREKPSAAAVPSKRSYAISRSVRSRIGHEPPGSLLLCGLECLCSVLVLLLYKPKKKKYRE